MTELCDLSAVELRRLIGAKEISPVELLKSCKKRIRAVNPTLNAVTSTVWPRAEKEAKAAERMVMSGDYLGPLHGIPLGVKDLDDAEGMPTTSGSPIFAKNYPKQDGIMVASCRRAGAIVVGKTNVPEFGAGANTNNPVFGPTGNPFDPKRICGGSSGGSAVALATSMLPLCTGSDTGGSLRIPAAFCGVVGVRGSPGLVPSERRGLGWTPLSVLGPMGRTTADASLMLSAIAVYDSMDPFSTPNDSHFAELKPVDLSQLRVAVTEDFGFCPVDSRIRKTFRDRVKRFRSSFARCEWATPDMGEADRAFEVLRAVSFLAGFKEHYEKRRHQLGPNLIANYEEGLRYSAADVAWAHAEQTRIFRRVQEFHKDFDLILSPTVSVPPFPWTQLYADKVDGKPTRTYFHWLALTYAMTLTGHPSTSIPCGKEPTGTPFGLMVTGPHRTDRFTLECAHALEQLFQRDPVMARPIPDIKKLSRR
ncbi:MAG: amidase [Rhodospirillaceae bacterium]|nr:amidase [Rhodospirillaceae bacterium]